MTRSTDQEKPEGDNASSDSEFADTFRPRLSDEQGRDLYIRTLVECDAEQPKWRELTIDDQLHPEHRLCLADRITIERIEAEGSWYDLSDQHKRRVGTYRRLKARLDNADEMLSKAPDDGRAAAIAALDALVQALGPAASGSAAVRQLRDVLINLTWGVKHSFWEVERPQQRGASPMTKLDSKVTWQHSMS